MSFRTRMLVACAVVAFIPIALLAFGFRQEMAARQRDGYQQRLDTVAAAIQLDLKRESAGVGSRLTSLAYAISRDNRFRLAAVAGLETERQYLLEYAGDAMRLTGLSMLQIQDEEGRIISSGHFRNEHGRVESGIPMALARAADGIALMVVRAPEGEFLALARTELVPVGGRTFALVGGVTIDQEFLARLARNGALVSLRYDGRVLSSRSEAVSGAANGTDAASHDIVVPLIRPGGDAPQIADAVLVVMQPLGELRELLRAADSWLLRAAVLSALAVLGLAVWMSSRVSRRLAALAEKTAVLDLDRLDVEFDSGTDEIGAVSRLLGDLTGRLRTSTARVREAERRATMGELARQVNHDIKNGLIPLRNVMRHLAQVDREDPGAVRSVLAERRPTIDSSIAYLETLATNYERLSAAPARRACDVNALVADVVRGERGHEHVEMRTQLAPDLPPIVGDPVAFRRILENLTANAVDSLESKPGRITVSTELIRSADEPPSIRVTVADTGRGMSAEEAGRIFTDFYTTKEGGTGLGLSIVRRLVMDLRGTVRVESEPGAGTRMIVDLPVHT